MIYGYLTRSKRSKCPPHTDHFGLAIPAFRYEWCSILEGFIHYIKTVVSAVYLVICPLLSILEGMAWKLSTEKNLHRMITYLGATILVPPGINVSSIQRPWGGVTRVLILIAGGNSLSVSLMTPFRWGSTGNALESAISIPCSSWKIFSACSGCLASK